MMKTGWHVPTWSDEIFTILDVAARLGSGVGSFGVDRYYILIQGIDNNHVILDVKYEPPGAVAGVLSEDDKAWYQILFANDAARAVEGQRRLTSYTDPYTGWVLLNGKPFTVRERSPWKDSPDLDKLTEYRDFDTFIAHVAMATATSHVRGTPAKSPGQFKEVLARVWRSKRARKSWGESVAELAFMYRDQVELDYQCFKAHAEAKFPPAAAASADAAVVDQESAEPSI